MATREHYQQQLTALDLAMRQLTCYRDARRVRDEATTALRTYPGLHPRVARHPNVAVDVLAMAGTIPVIYANNQYNIPVEIFLPDAFPSVPPVCFVRPTPEMIITPQHKHVGADGMVYLPYLSTWAAATCNVSTLCANMARVFGEVPPVRSRPAPSASQPVLMGAASGGGGGGSYTPVPLGAATGMGSSATSISVGNLTQFTGANSGGGGAPAPYPGAYGAYGGYPAAAAAAATPQQYAGDPAEIAKRTAVAVVTEKLQRRIRDHNERTTREVDSLLSESNGLKTRIEALMRQRESTESEMGRMNDEMGALTRQMEDITKWLDANSRRDESFDIDEVTHPKDVLSRQLLLLVAEDAAIDDAIYQLDKMLQQGKIDLVSYLKHTRNLARDQFLKKALLRKVTAARAQAMSMRPPM